MADKTTTIRLTDDDQECVAALSKRTGIRSTTEVLCYSLRRALGDRSEPEEPPADHLDALRVCREALAKWSPTDFEGTRAKLRAEEACERALGR